MCRHRLYRCCPFQVGYALHLAMCVRAPKILRTLVEFEDLYEIFIYSLFHRFIIIHRLLQEKVVLSNAKINNYIRIPVSFLTGIPH